MIGLMFLALIPVLAFVLLRRRRRRQLLSSPLAGYDTGVRSPYRTPGRFFKPHKGF